MRVSGPVGVGRGAHRTPCRTSWGWGTEAGSDRVHTESSDGACLPWTSPRSFGVTRAGLRVVCQLAPLTGSFIFGQIFVCPQQRRPHAPG